MKQVVKRFRNRALPDLVERTTINGSKIWKSLSNQRYDNSKQKRNLKRYALIFASWYLFVKREKRFQDQNFNYIKKLLKIQKIHWNL